MIVWLASYPRSGNTLLRTILFQCFGIHSFSDEIDPEIEKRVGLSKNLVTNIGHKPLETDWEEFYENAKFSDERYFIKTHNAPRDSGKAIYVVRDGRQALISYQKYHQSFLGDHALNLMELILGLDHYGGWPEHLESWEARENTLLLRYEDMVDASPDTLNKISEFIDMPVLLSNWKNPFQSMKGENPEFFRKGMSKWVAPPSWGELIDSLFFLLCGSAMARLGYIGSNGELTQSVKEFSDSSQIIQMVKRLVDGKDGYLAICKERMDVINLLDAEVTRLKGLVRE